MNVEPAAVAAHQQTDVGDVPGDWCVRTLLQLADGKKELFDDGDWVEARYLTDRGIRLIQTGNIGEGCFAEKLDSKKFINEESFKTLRCKDLHIGDLLICRLAEPAGRACVLPDIGERRMITAVDVTIFRPRCEVADRRYLQHVFSTRAWFRAVEDRCGGSTRSRISRSALGRIAVGVPSLREQRAIADALGDVDALLDALSRQIAKQRDLKQAAMQQLLTGRARLPGFTGEWPLSQLGDVLAFQVGYPFPSADFNKAARGPRLVKNRDLKSDDEIVYFGGSYAQGFVVNDGDVLVGMDGDFIPCLWNKGGALLNQRVGRIMSSARIDPRYAYYRLRGPLDEIQRQTSATTVKHLSHGDIAKICLQLPRGDEQTAIATVLSDMDAEITALEARRAKTGDLKQAMLQELLTGRTRLV